MSVILAIVSVIITSLSFIATLFLIFQLKRALNDFSHVSADLLQNAFNEFGPQLSAEIEKGFQPVVSKAMGILAKKSGISRSLKAMEKDMIADGINQVTGGIGGEQAAKYLQKYPIVKDMVMFFASKMAQGKGGEKKTSSPNQMYKRFEYG